MIRIPPNPQRVIARAGKKWNGPMSHRKLSSLLQLLANLNLIQDANVSFSRKEWNIWVMNKKEWNRIFTETLDSINGKV